MPKNKMINKNDDPNKKSPKPRAPLVLSEEKKEIFSRKDNVVEKVSFGSDEKSVLLCDGKERPIDRPKSKNIRHVESIGITVTEAEMSTNRALKKALGRLNAEINGNT